MKFMSGLSLWAVSQFPIMSADEPGPKQNEMGVSHAE